MWRVEQQDALEFVRSLADASVACAITDPPHIGLEKHRAHGTTTRLMGQWFDTLDDERVVAVLMALYPKLKLDAYLWVFADARLEHVLVRQMTGGTFGVRFPLSWTCWGSWVWVKTGKPGMGYHGRRSHERILMFERGKPRLRDLGQRDVIECPQVRARDVGGRRPYPTEKPVEVLRTLIRCSTDEDDLVVDPFCGSGSTGEAAVWLGRRFAGCDTSAVAVEIARKRMEG